MTDENTQAAPAVVNNEATEAPKEVDIVTGSGEVNADNKTISVDLFGVSIDLPLDKAKELIGKRDQRTTAFKDLSDKVGAFETQIVDTTRRAEAAEAAAKGNLVEAEAMFSSKSDELVKKYQSKLIKAEIVEALSSNDKFLNTDETRQDAIALVMAQNVFTLDSNDNIIGTDSKTVKDLTNSFVDSREAFQTAANTGTINQPRKVAGGNEKPNMKKALGKFLDDIG